ncbi:MAG TPA: hypothetical protein VNA30_03500, partial [Mycobacteriales bacterium]|nr:hypothetical protein [Mycobacteriales bacterium]
VHAVDGVLPAKAQLAGVDAAAAARAAGTSTARLTWRASGPAGFPPLYAPYGGTDFAAGRVSSLALVPRLPRRAYAGAATGGVWRTDDDGRHWRPVGDSLPTLAVGSVATHPTRPDIVWVGTGEANEAGTAVGLGVFRSTDGGRRWSPANGDAPFRGCATADLIVLPDAVLATVLAASLQGDAVINSRCPQPGVWRSADDGRHWARVVPGHVQDLVQARNGALYAAGGGDVGVVRSDDAGQTWRRLPLGLPPEAVVRRAVIDVAPDDPDRVVAAFASPTGSLLGTWTSGDGGGTWRPVLSASSPCGYSGGPEPTGQCWYDITLLAEPEGRFLLGGVRLHRFDEAGGSAVHLGLGSIHVDQHALARDAAGRIWLGNDGGIYRSADGGRTWAGLNRGLAITQFNHGGSVTPTGALIGGTQDNGTLLGRNGRWREVLGGDGGATVAPAQEPGLLYASYQQMRPNRSWDDGESWIPIEFGLPPYEPRAFYAPLVGDPTRPETVYTATGRVFRSTDAGKTWLPISPPMDNVITALAVAPSDPLTIYSGSSRGVRVTRDGGLTWLPAGTAPLRSVTSLMVDPRDAKRVWLTLGGYGGAHVLESTDAGASWRDVGVGLPDLPVHDVLLDLPTGDLYAGTEAGVFRRTGTRWTAEPVGLPAVPVTDLVLGPSRTVVAFTYGRSTFTAKLP